MNYYLKHRRVLLKRVKINENLIKLLIIFAACFAAELLLSNCSAIALKLGGYETAQLSVGEAELSGGTKKCAVNDEEITIDKGKLRFDDVNTKMKNICIETNNGFYGYLNVEVSFTDDNFACDGAFDYNRNTYQIYVDSESKNNYINLSSYGEVKTLELTIPDKSPEPFEITSVKLNAAPPFGFKLSRFGILLLVCLCAVFGAWRWRFSDGDYIIIKFISAVICVTVIASSLLIINALGESALDNYPLDNINSADQYEQLFCAFKDGRLNINVDADVDEIEKLDNPYDRSARDEAELKGDFWDRAYYDGKFYSYFGVAPVFTVYLPVYIFTGKLPGAMLASAIVTVYAVIFLTMLYIQLLKCFFKEVPFLISLLGYLALIFGSSVFSFCSEKVFYYIASISGIGWTAAFFCFILKAYYERNFKKRIVFLALTGISVAMIAASRPTMLIYCVTALVPAIYIMKSKEETPKHKAAYLCSIGAPILCGAVLLMIYNYLRFDSPFEFGFNYQLTVSVAGANTFSLAYIPATIYHYFLQMPDISSQFPYINISYKTFSSYPRYTYLCDNMGVLAYPVTWGIALIPANDRKKDSFKSYFIMSILFEALVIAFLDMCMAGSHYRYTGDILFPIIIAALAAIFDVLNKLRGSSKRVYVTAYIFSVLAMAATIAVGYLLVFGNENKYFIFNYASVTEMIKAL